jgi:penicillin-insensitive murein endopeptidase
MSGYFRRIALTSLGACLAALPALRAQGQQGSQRDRSAVPMSIGSPTGGTLVGGVMLREHAELRLRWPDGPRWALPQLVSILERASRRVDHRYPGSVLLVGDLSRREGGALAGHVSHTSGRDADVGFYYADEAGKVVRTERLLPVAPTGSVTTAKLHFDEARNWALVEALLTDADVVVQKIFIAEMLKQRLLDYARKHGARGDVLERAAVALRQPGAGAPHDDHFHVRIACPRGTAPRCISDPEPARARPERTAALEPSSR